MPNGAHLLTFRLVALDHAGALCEDRLLEGRHQHAHAALRQLQHISISITLTSALSNVTSTLSSTRSTAKCITTN